MRYRLFAALVSAIALLVPQRRRQRWVEEWKGELWHAVGPGCARRPRSLWAMVSFVRGGVRDALVTRAIGKTSYPSRPRNVESLRADLRVSVRSLRRQPGFTAVAVGTLAIGIGANTAIFSVVLHTLIDALPFGSPDQLVRVYERRPHQQRERNPASFPDFADWRDNNTVFSSMAAYGFTTSNFSGGEAPEELLGAYVTAGFFHLLEIAPQRGQVFTEAEDQPGHDQVVVLSDGLWRGRFGGDNGIIGSTITMDDRPYTVVAIMPRSFDYPFGSTFWVPLAGDRERWSRGSHNLNVVARLAPGATIDRAAEEMDLIARRLETDYPETNTGHYANVFRMHDEVVRTVRPSLVLFLGAVGFVLLIVCANLANMQLARGTGRAKELAVRASLGATRRRIARQLLTENVVLGILGGTAGLVLATIAVQMSAGFVASQSPWVRQLDLDLRAFAFALGVSLVASLLFGILPTIQHSRVDLAQGLRESVVSSRRRTAVRGALVVAEVALATLLLVGAGLLGRSFIKLLDVDPGFDASNVLTMGFSLTSAKYPDGGRRNAFIDLFQDRVRSLPGVQSVGYTWLLPLSGEEAGRNFDIEGRETEQGFSFNARWRIADSGYFETMRIGLVRGRMFSTADRVDAPRVVLINETMVETYWPDEDPLGQHIRLNSADPWSTVIGVVRSVHHSNLQDPVLPEMYFSRDQTPASGGVMLARTAGDPTALAEPIRRVVAAIDPNLPLRDVATMREYVDHAVTPARALATLTAGFGCVALALAAMGIYGVISYSVGQRTREIGIRMALGGGAATIVSMVARQGLVLALAGVAVGLVGAIAITHGMRGFLFGVGSTDVTTYGGVGLTLSAIAFLATLIPARRATRVDPVLSLRQE